MNPIAKCEAQQIGLKKYFTGKPCKHGHVCERWVRNNACLGCSNANAKVWAKENNVRVATNARAWRKAHPEKAKMHRDAANARYSAKEENKVRNRERAKARYTLKRDALLEQARVRRLLNIERIRAYQQTWYRMNKDHALALARNRKARKRAAPGKHTANDIREIFRLQKGKCAYCRGDLGCGNHIDHIIPLILGGANDRRNIQLLCPTCNLSKGPKHPIDFARQLGRLI